MPKNTPKWTEEQQDKIIEWLCGHIASSSKGIKSILEAAEDFPEDVGDVPGKGSIFGWLGKREDLFDHYARAKVMQAEYITDEMIDIADDGSNDYTTKTNSNGDEYETFDNEHVQRSRLRIDTRKWYSGRLRPDRFGDKVEVNNKHSGSLGGTWEVVVVDPTVEG